jgi:tetratricopeptide (TPR) repeat protein
MLWLVRDYWESLAAFWLFGVFHPLAAREPFKKALARRTSPFFVDTLWRLIYSLISFLWYYQIVGALHWGLHPAYDAWLVRYPDWLWQAVTAIHLGAVALICGAFLQSDYLEFLGLRQAWRGVLAWLGRGAPRPPLRQLGARAGTRANDLTTCEPGQVWDRKKRKCLQRHSSVLPDSDLAEYAYALAKADRFQEAIDVLDLLENPNTPRALNYRGYATRKLGRIDEGIGYYRKSIALDPTYPQVREYLGEAYVIEGKFDLAKDQLATIEKICGKDCEYYGELVKALRDARPL